MPAFGLYLPQLRMDLPTIEARARTAEAAGFDSVWLMDHLAAPLAPEADTWEAWTVATLLAARTERIRLGHLVLCDAFRHPAVLAKMVATLDHVSGGRLELGLGWGSVPDELRRWGLSTDPAPARARRLGETLEVLGRLLSGTATSFAGEFFTLEEVVARPTPLQQPVPVHLGGGGRRLTLPLVRRYADWWNCPSYALDRLPELLAEIGGGETPGGGPSGRTVRVSVQHPVGLAPSTASRDEVVHLAERRFGGWGGLVAGTPDEVAGRLAAEAAAGVELFVVQLHDFGAPQSVELFAREVIPRVAEAGR